MSYKFCIIKSIQELLTYHELIHSAFTDFEDRRLLEVTELTYVQALMDCVARPEGGFVCIVKNKNDLVLALGAVQYLTKEEAHLYSGWHNQKDPNLVKVVLSWLDMYLSKRGIKSYTFSTRRSSGAAIRCFEKKHGFKKDTLTFRRDL